MPSVSPRRPAQRSRKDDAAVAVDRPPIPDSEFADLRYDYSLMDDAVRDRARDAAVTIRRRQRNIVMHMIEIGDELITVKRLLPREFTKWLEIEFAMSISSANEFMNVSRRFGEFSTIIVEMGATVVRMLAAPSVPNEAIDAVIQASQRLGRPMLVREVKAIKATFSDSFRQIEQRPPLQLTVAEEDGVIDGVFKELDVSDGAAVATQKEFDDLTLADCLEVLTLAQRVARRVRELDPSLHYAVSNVLPPWAQLVMAVEKKVRFRHGE